jgi:hypothetical protein
MKIKRIFNFICFFVIVPVVTFLSIAVLVDIIRKFDALYFLVLIFVIGCCWAWLILAYRYLIKMFD